MLRKISLLEKIGWGTSNSSELIGKLQDHVDAGKPLPAEKHRRNMRYEVDDMGILHVTLYSTEIVTADMKHKKVMKVTEGGWNTPTTHGQIWNVLWALSNLGYPDIRNKLVDHEYDIHETDAQRRKKQEKIDEQKREDSRERSRQYRLQHKPEYIEHKRREDRSRWSDDPVELAELAKDTDVEIRKNVANSNHASIETLDLLAKDGDPNVRYRVADNEHANQKTLNMLAGDVTAGIRNRVAVNPSTNLRTLRMLMTDEDEHVRQVIVKHPKTTSDMLAILAEDKNPNVRSQVIKSDKVTPEILGTLAEDADIGIRQNVAGHYNTSLSTLNTLAKDEDQGVRMNVANNSQTTSDTLDMLAHDEDDEVRSYVVSNSNTKFNTFKLLEKDGNPDIAEKAVKYLREHDPQYEDPKEKEIREWEEKIADKITGKKIIASVEESYNGFKVGDPVEWNWGKEIHTGKILDFTNDVDCDIEPGIHASVINKKGDRFGVEVDELRRVAGMDTIAETAEINLIMEVTANIIELDKILALKVGEGGENSNLDKTNNLTNNNEEQNIEVQNPNGGNTEMNPITRDGSPVVDARSKLPAVTAGAGEVPETDFMSLAKANDPYSEVTATEKTDAPETNKIINDVLKKMPSATEHAEAEKVVDKAVSVKKASEGEEKTEESAGHKEEDVIANVVNRVKQLKNATTEIAKIVNEQESGVSMKPADIIARIKERMNKKEAKVDGAISDPVKGSEDAGKTPEESVSSIKTTKGEAKDRPVEPMGEGKSRYPIDKGDPRDSEAKAAESAGKKSETVYMKEPEKVRPVTNDGVKGGYGKGPAKGESIVQRKASLAGKLASFGVFADSDTEVAKRLHSYKVKYPVEKSPDMDFEGAASRTESEINKEHGERAKDTGVKSPMKTVLWRAKNRKQVFAARPAFQEMTDAQKGKVEEIAASLKDKEASGEIDSAFAVAVSKVQDQIDSSGHVKASADKENIKKQISVFKEALADINEADPNAVRKMEILEANVSRLEKEMEKLSYIPMSTKPTSQMSWEEIITEGNAIYADLQRVLGEVDDMTTPFIEEAEKAKKVASIRTAAEEKNEGFEELGDGKDKDEKEEKDDKGEKKDKGGKDGKDGKKKDVKEVAGDTIDLLKDIRDAAKEIGEEIEDHLKTVEKKTGIPVPPASEKLPAVGPIGEGEGELMPPLPEEEMGIPGMEMGGGKPFPGKLSWLNMIPKTAAEEEQLVQEIKKDPEMPSPEEKWKAIKQVRQTGAGWKAVFTKLACPSAAEDATEKKEDEKKDEKKAEASVDKKNSYWSVLRGNELVLRASIEDLYKNKAVEAFDWASSRQYGEKLLSAVLNNGLEVTASSLGIESLIKTAAAGKKVDPKAYYKGIYPASYVSELFKEHKKKAEAEISKLKTTLAEVQADAEALAKVNEDLTENQVLHAKAEKALAIVHIAVEKGVIQPAEVDAVVDGMMTMNDEGFETFSSTIMKAPTFKKATTIDEKIAMVKDASLKSRPVSLEKPIVLSSSNASGLDALRSQLEGCWRTPGAAK